MRKLLKLLIPLAVILGIGSWVIADHFVIRSMPPFIFHQPPFLRTSTFTLGVNYPWSMYGQDFGSNVYGHTGVSEPRSAAIVESDFAALEADGIHYVRWFVWCDGRSGLVFNADGSVSGITPDFYQDMDSAISIAKRHHIRIVFVLLDFYFFPQSRYGGIYGGHARMVSDPRLLSSFLENAVKPVLQRYGREQTIAAWEVVNEPEWTMKIERGSNPVPRVVSVQDMHTLVVAVAGYVHHYAIQPVTVGSAERRHLSLWLDCNLDFYEFHSYPNLERRNPLSVPAQTLGLNKPVMLGEFPTSNARYTPTEYLNFALTGGYSGAMPWSYRGQDAASDYNSARKSMQSWLSNNKNVVQSQMAKPLLRGDLMHRLPPPPIVWPR